MKKTMTRNLIHAVYAIIGNSRLNELKKTDDKVAVIARSLGFCSAAYFVKRFRDEHGMTPHRFRAQSLSKGASFQRLPV